MSFPTFDANRVDRIVETLAAMLQRRSIARELETLRHFAIFPEQIDALLLAAISTSLNLEDDHVVADVPEIRIDSGSLPAGNARAA